MWHCGASEGATDYINALCVMGVAFLFARQVIVENLATKNQTLLEGLSGLVTCSAVSQNGRRVAAGCGDVRSSRDSDSGPANCLMVWEYNTEGGYWCEKATLAFERGNVLPVTCLAFDPTGQFVAAVGVNGSAGLRVSVSVWDLSLDSALPIATRHVVLGVYALEASSRSIVGVVWESSRRFVTVGASGLLEFELCGSPAAFAGLRDGSSGAPTLRYRALLKPEEVVDQVRSYQFL